MRVFHLDIESFITSVERLKDRSLRDRPLVIAPPTGRATIIAASPDAKALGLAKGTPIHYVRKNFPRVTIQTPNHTLYENAHHYIMDIVRQYSPVVEPLSYGHIAMDMTGMTQLFGSLENAALKLGREINARARLNATVGIAGNKLVSTIAAKEIQKHTEPLYSVEEGREPRFLAPLPCRALPESEDKGTRKLLFELNINRILHIQAIRLEIFSFAMGAVGTRLHRHANGIDPQPVTPPESAATLQTEHYFHPDTNDDDLILAALYRMSEKLGFQLRAKGGQAGWVNVELRYSDDVWRRRRMDLVDAIQDDTIHQTLLRQYDKFCDRRCRVRYLRLTVGGLKEGDTQPSLFEQTKQDKLATPLDRIRARFGGEAISYGKGLKAMPKNSQRNRSSCSAVRTAHPLPYHQARHTRVERPRPS